MYPTVYLASPLGCLIGVSHLTCSSSWTSPLFKKFLYIQSSSFQMIPIPNFQLFRQKNLCPSLISFSLTHHHPNHQQISPDLLSKYIQNPITAPHYHQSDWGITFSCLITVGCPCWSLPQICSLFLVQETKRYIKNVVGSSHSSVQNPPMVSLSQE